MVPAFAIVGAGFTVIVTFELDGVQGELVMVQAKTLFPKPKPVTVVVGKSEFVITPVPETNVHAPVPTPGKFPFIVVVGEETHRVWFEPALATEGI